MVSGSALIQTAGALPRMLTLPGTRSAHVGASNVTAYVAHAKDRKTLLDKLTIVYLGKLGRGLHMYPRRNAKIQTPNLCRALADVGDTTPSHS